MTDTKQLREVLQAIGWSDDLVKAVVDAAVDTTGFDDPLVGTDSPELESASAVYVFESAVTAGGDLTVKVRT